MCRKNFTKIVKEDQNGVFQREITVNKKQNSETESDTEYSELEHCYICKQDGILLICETCEVLCHPKCDIRFVGEHVPDGYWFCEFCTAVYEQINKSKKASLKKKKD